MQMPDVSYEYYLSDYCCGREGRLTAGDFDFYCRRATEEVALRINPQCDVSASNSVRNAVCEAAELIFTCAASGDIKSETVDGYSVTYKDTAPTARQLAHILEKHLGGSGLLYRGV